MPAVLQKPGVADDDPRALYHHNLVHGESVTWYSASASPTELYEYVLELLEVSAEQMRHTVEGIVRSGDESLMLVAARSPRGAVCSVWGTQSDGTARINGGLQREWDKMMEEMSRGAYVGNRASAWWAPVVRGVVPEDFGDSEVFDFINGCDVVPMGQPDAAPSRELEPDPFDDSKVLRYLEADPDVADIEVVHDQMFRAQVSLNGHEGLPPVPLVVSTGLNDQMLMILCFVDSQQLSAALDATSEIGVVGLASVGDNHALRYGAFKEHSDMMALVNGLQAVALAYYKYVVAQA